MIYKSELQPQIDKLRYGFKNRACTQALVKNEEKLKGLVMKDLFRKCRCCESHVCTKKNLLTGFSVLNFSLQLNCKHKWLICFQNALFFPVTSGLLSDA